jgi:Domain of unknown function (DUF427)
LRALPQIRHHDRIIADTTRALVLYESGFAPRWYVQRADVDESALTPVKLQTFCPYKGLCSYYSRLLASLGPRGIQDLIALTKVFWVRSAKMASRRFLADRATSKLSGSKPQGV